MSTKLSPKGYEARLAAAAERQADALETIADHLTGVINLLETLDVTVNNGLVALADD